MRQGLYKGYLRRMVSKGPLRGKGEGASLVWTEVVLSRSGASPFMETLMLTCLAQ